MDLNVTSREHYSGNTRDHVFINTLRSRSSSLVEYLLSKHKALGCIPSIEKEEREGNIKRKGKNST